MDFGNKMRQAIFDKKIKQKDLALKVGKNPQEINAYIRGKKKPDAETFQKILLELDLVAEFFPGYQKIGGNSVQKEIDARVRDLEKQVELLTAKIFS